MTFDAIETRIREKPKWVCLDGSGSVWADGKIFGSKLAIWNNEIMPIDIKIDKQGLKLCQK